MTSKEKIDEILGISADQSVDDFLNSIEITQDIGKLSSAFDVMTDEIDNNLNKVDNLLITKNVLELSTINDSMKEVEDLVKMSKNMFKHVYEQIITTTLLDSEVIGAAAKLLESIHINIAEFIGLYNEKTKFINSLKKMQYQHMLDLEKMAKKQEYDLQKMDRKIDQGAINAEEGNINASFEDMIKALANAEKTIDAI